MHLYFVTLLFSDSNKGSEAEWEVVQPPTHQDGRANYVEQKSNNILIDLPSETTKPNENQITENILEHNKRGKN